MHQNLVQIRNAEVTSGYAVVIVHGRTQSAADMMLNADRLKIDGVRFVFPQADNNSWYPDKFMAPIEANEPSLSAALAHYESVVTGLIDEGFPAERIILSGFSQGACLTSQYMSRYPRRYGGAVIWTGGLIGPKGSVWPLRPVLSGMPAYITSSEIDPWVPPERAQETHDWLIQSGADATIEIFANRDHSVSDWEIEKGRNLILRVMGR